MKNDFDGVSFFLSIIILNWNGIQVIGECLESLRKQNNKKFEVIIVDNGSTDGSIEYITQNYPEVKLIKLDKNFGVPIANNKALDIAKGDYLAFINNDVVLDKNWTESVYKAIQQYPRAGVFTSKVLNYYRPKIIDNTGLLLYPDGLGRGRGRGEEDNKQYDNKHEVLLPSTCACVFKRDIALQKFEELYFVYFEDVDLGLRAILNGYYCIYMPQAIVYHKYSYSYSAYSTTKLFYVERNRVWLLFKLLPIEYILFSPIYTFIRYYYQFLSIIRNEGTSAKFLHNNSTISGVKTIIKAWFSAFLKLPEIIVKRKKIMSNKKISMKEYRSQLKNFEISARDIVFKD